MAKLDIPEGGLFGFNNKDTNENSNVNNVNVNTNKNVNIVIKVKEDDLDEPIRSTYYLKPSTIRKIRKLSRNAEMGVSEFLQTVLDNILNNIEIK